MKKKNLKENNKKLTSKGNKNNVKKKDLRENRKIIRKIRNLSFQKVAQAKQPNPIT